VIRLKRAYEPAAPDDGRRYLVDRVWPRGRTWDELGLEAAGHGDVTLVYGARDERHNQAVVLKEVLDERLGRREPSDRSPETPRT
jgi:uncharacterized protein YeaO (DUF488 family)